MYRLMIVDDESTTRESLKSYIPWSNLGIGEVRLADNGLSAIQLAVEFNPDIALCDIQMPKLSGIEFAERLRDSHPDCSIIFLSGYTEKAYLKSAIQLKAISYLEKPVNIDDIITAVREAITEHEQNLQKAEELDLLKKNLHHNLPVIRQHELMEFISCKSFQGATQHHDAFFASDSRFTVMVISFSDNQAPYMDDETYRYNILNALYEKIDPDTFIAGFNDDSDLIYVGSSRVDITQAFTDFLFTRIMGSIHELFANKYILRAGIGTVAKSAADIYHSYETAAQALRFKFYLSGNGTIRYDTLGDFQFKVPEDFFDRFAKLLRKNDTEKTVQIVKNLGRTLVDKRPENIDYVKDVFFRLFLTFNEIAKEKRIRAQPSYDRKFVWQRIQEFSCVDEMMSALVLDIQDINESCNTLGHVCH